MMHISVRLALLLLFCVAQAPLFSAATDVVLYGTDASLVAGGWRKEADATAAASTRLRHPNAGGAKLSAALSSPAHYFEIPFEAEAGVAYRLWIRGKADSNYWGNDSVFVQFSDSVNSSGSALYRIGTTSSTVVNVEDCSGCGLAGWGWQDNGWGSGVLGPLVRFATTGSHRIRVQTREDGLSIDQIVLSPATYLTAAPGALKNDTTIVPRGGTSSTTLVRGPYLQRITASTARVVWATRDGGASEVRYSSGGTAKLAPADTTFYPATTTGLSYDYHQHSAELLSLAPAATYTYDVFTGGADAAPSRTFSLTTAPSSSSSATVKFVAFGDSGVGSDAQRQVASALAADTFDFALHAGDLAYGSSDGLGAGTYKTLSGWFFDVYTAWLHRRPIWPSMGNHDSRSANSYGRHYINMFDLPGNERHYSFDWGAVHVVVLDTEREFQDTTRRQAQLQWLESDLASTNRRWKIAVFHRSPFSSGGEHGSDLVVRQAFAPLFERYGVQLAISAHEHDYERTTPQRTTSGGSPVVYVVTGGGGGPLYPAGTSSFTAAAASRYHYVRAAVADCSLTLEAVGTDRKVFDRTVIDGCTTVPPGGGSGADVVIRASDVIASGTIAGKWGPLSDATAADGIALRNPNSGAAKRTTALASPPDYFEYSFTADAGTPYRLWMRGRATSNYWGNDSVFVQFDRSVNASGSSAFRIGTTAATVVNLEDCSGCGLSGWGWQDNGWGKGVLGPEIYFSASGPQRLRVQVREDGFIIDQIVLSPSRYLAAAPGALKNDTTIVPR